MAHRLFKNLDDKQTALVGMVHLLPLPGSPGWAGSISKIIDAALRDANALAEGGVDAIIVENMGDLPYLRGTVAPETVAATTLAAARVVELGLPVGVQLLAAANREALGVALAAGASFIRVEAFAYAHIADEGLLNACAGELTRARAALDADVAIWADIQKKHYSHALTADLSLAEIAKGTNFCGADALIVTGAATGAPTSLEDVRSAKDAGLPVAVGSGINAKNIKLYCGIADALIVGSSIKYEGIWRNPVDRTRVEALIKRLR